MNENRLYVGNLYCLVRKDHLIDLFSKYGRVKNIDIIEGTGYGYVEMSSQSEAEKAISELDGTEFLERVIKVRRAGIQVLVQ
ncbi:MAG: RNA-binding protein [Candidatus Aminicenantes bacterium]|nr:RNA-binding protein [Candidatus Aminicenantes bacterium]